MANVRIIVLALLAAATQTRGWTPSSPVSQCRGENKVSFTPFNGSRDRDQSRQLVLFDAAEPNGESVAGTKTKLATDLARLFDINEMAYTVMVREENKGSDGKLTPEELIAAIQKDGMFGEDFEEYCETHASDGDVAILDIGKFSDDMSSSEPLPEEDNLVIPGKGNYLVHMSFAEGILATMRVVVD